MSKFFVGCLVRMVACEDRRAMHLVGTETRIIGEEVDAWPIWVLGYAPINGERVIADKHNAADYLVPILPSGAAPSELSFTELMDRLKAGEVECV